jgi:rhomboid protease GluP
VPLPLRWKCKLDQLRDLLFGGFRKQPDNPRPRMCPACGTLVGTTATKCHVCGANVRFGMAAASRSLSRYMPSGSPVTFGILCLCFLLYGVSFIWSVRQGFTMLPQGGGFGALFGIGGIPGEVLFRLGSTIPFPYIELQPWRIVTAVFLHGSLMHIIFNMYVLMDIGPRVEEVYGSARYFTFFVVTGTVGYIPSALAGYHSVGASGALLGLVGLLLAVTLKSRSAASQMIRSSLIRWLLYIGVFGLMVPGIDNYAHAGGLAAGFLIGRIAMDRPPADMIERRNANIIAWATGIVVAVCFGFMLYYLIETFAIPFMR